MQRCFKTTASTVVSLSIFLGVQVLAFGQEVKTGNGIEGVWQTVVTPRICATGLAVGVTFPGIISFQTGGTMSGTSTAASSTYGVWNRDQGARQYSFSTVSLKYDSSGVLVGSRRIDQTVSVDKSGDSFTSTGGFHDFDVAGNPTATGCSTSVGTRFQ